MTNPRRMIGWYLLFLVVVAAVATAIIGVEQAPAQPQTSLQLAVKNTTAATSYIETFAQTSQTNGSVALHAVIHTPDRVAAYQDVGGQRQYVVIVGSTVYQGTAATTARAATVHYSVQQVPGAASQLILVPAYLDLANRAKDTHRSGNTFSFTLKTPTGVQATLEYTVTGEYVSKVVVTYPGAREVLGISQVNNAPKVDAPSASSVSGNAG